MKKYTTVITAVVLIMAYKTILCHFITAIRNKKKAIEARANPDTGPAATILPSRFLIFISSSSGVCKPGLPMPAFKMELKTKYAVTVYPSYSTDGLAYKML